jgi:DNA-binding transcriptional LysR family regulator
MEGLRGGECGRLVVGASSTPGTYLLPPRLGAFRREHPGVELSLEIGDTHEVLERVLDGRLDLGVVGETQFETSLEAERFGSDHLVLILSPGHPLGAKSELTPEDLADEPFVLREKGSSTREVLERALEHHGITPRVVMELGNPEAIKKSVAAGLGISFVSEHAVELEVRAGVLAARRVRGLDASRGIFLVRRRSLRPAPLLERLLTALRA